MGSLPYRDEKSCTLGILLHVISLSHENIVILRSAATKNLTAAGNYLRFFAFTPLRLRMTASTLLLTERQGTSHPAVSSVWCPHLFT
jgi:hypothetical protein